MEMGKREITFEVYEKSMIWLLEETRSHEGIFGRAFMSLTWNLMCRGVNTCVCLKHLMWRADAFGISFSHVKNDSAGSRNWHPRHIYTNPDNYHVYCVTAVTEYLLCFPPLFQDGNGMLFPGPKQEERFGAILLRVLEKHKDELLELGYEPNDIGDIPFGKLQAHMLLVVQLQLLQVFQSITGVGGLWEVYVMFICCMSVLVTSM